MDVCDHNFKSRLAPGQNLSIDEAMIPFDVRLYWKQYAETTGQVGDEAVVYMRRPDRLLPRLQRLHWQV